MRNFYRLIGRGCVLFAISATLSTCATQPGESIPEVNPQRAPSPLGLALNAAALPLEAAGQLGASVPPASAAPVSAATVSLPQISAPLDPAAAPSDLSCRPKLALVPEPHKAVSLVLGKPTPHDPSQPFSPLPSQIPLQASKKALVTDINGFPLPGPDGEPMYADIPRISVSYALRPPPDGAPSGTPPVDTEYVGPVSTITIDPYHPEVGPDGKPVLGPDGKQKRGPYLIFGPDGRPTLGPVGLVKLTDQNQLPFLDDQHTHIAVVGPAGTAAVARNTNTHNIEASVTHYADPTLSSFDSMKVIGSDGASVEKLVSEVMLPKPILGPNGLPLSPMYGAVPPIVDAQCEYLAPLTRLILENAGVSSTYQYTNEAGLTNLAGGSPASTAQIQSSNAYSFGIGYVSKPILKQILALWEPPDGRKDVCRQGTVSADFLLNALTLSASGGWGRTLMSKDGMVSDALTTRPFYSVSLTYGFDLERLYEHVLYGDARPVDPGYYYQPSSGPLGPGFWPQPFKYNNDRPN